MSEPQANEPGQLRVHLRGATLSESASLVEREGNLFLGIDQPPPVGTLLALHDTDGANHEPPRAFEVATVVEVAGELADRVGCFGRVVDRDLEASFSRVGSEHLGGTDTEATLVPPVPPEVPDEFDMDTEPPVPDASTAADPDAAEPTPPVERAFVPEPDIIVTDGPGAESASDLRAAAGGDTPASDSGKGGRRAKKRKSRKRG